MSSPSNARFLVLDALGAPFGGQILRLRLQTGQAPPLRSLKGARLEATGPRGETAHVQVEGFAAMGGKPSEERFRRTGRVDVHVMPDSPSQEPIGLRWDVGVLR